jgi:hypothetical protein
LFTLYTDEIISRDDFVEQKARLELEHDKQQARAQELELLTAV